MFTLLRRLLCRHFWINILRLGGEIRTKRGTFPVEGTVFIDYCPKCKSFRDRHDNRRSRNTL